MIFDEWWRDYGIEQASIAEKSAARKGWQAGVAIRDSEIAGLMDEIHRIQNGSIRRDMEMRLHNAFIYGTSHPEMYKNELDYCREKNSQLREHVAMLRKHLSLAIIGLDESWEELNESRVELMRVAIAETEPK